jgi:uncharacterized membrane protein
MISKERADQIAGGVFLIGLGLLFTNVLPFWPGILLVIGASAIARGMAEGQAWYNASGGLWMIGLGLVFLLNFSWPVILILIGVTMLFGYNAGCAWWPSEKGKRKNDEKAKNSEVIV